MLEGYHIETLSGNLIQVERIGMHSGEVIIVAQSFAS